MNIKKKLQTALYTKYPTIFKQRSLPSEKSAMCIGIACGNGWFKILNELCSILDEIKAYTGLSVVATQVKEKFGTLRFYNTFEVDLRWKIKYWIRNIKFFILHKKPGTIYRYCIWAEVIDKLISEAEHRSAYVCETCGNPGRLAHKEGWLGTRCEKCAKKEGYKFKKE